jgi:hypothetical protein
LERIILSRKVKIISLCVFILIILICAEVIMINTATGSGSDVQVICAASDISKGELITLDLLVLKKIPLEMSGSALTGKPEDYVGQKVGCYLHKGEVLYSDNLLASSKFKDEGKVMMAFDLKGVQANGWWIEEDCIVDLMLVYNGDEKNVKTIQDIRVAALLDEAGNRLISGSEAKRPAPPVYMSVEVTADQALLLAGIKSNDKIVLAVK